jgi:hypothetical protein
MMPSWAGGVHARKPRDAGESGSMVEAALKEFLNERFAMALHQPTKHNCMQQFT